MRRSPHKVAPQSTYLMLAWRLVAVLFLLAPLALLTGCTVESSEGPTGSGGPNEPPTIWSVTSTRTVVLPGEEVVLACNASDPNGDALSYQWDKSAGRFVDDEAFIWQVTWEAPGVEGEATISVRVSDGIELVQQAVTITVTSPPGEPTDPSPADDAAQIDPDNAVLIWTPGEDADETTVYDVYFGTTSKPSLVLENTADTSYTRTDLEADTRYYWRVVVKDEHLYQTSGPVWTFTTGTDNDPPGMPFSPYPSNHATGIPTDIRLSWFCSDPNSDPLTFDVKLSTVDPPTTVKFSHTATSYDPLADLQEDTEYYWQIVAKDDRQGETEGPVWSFTTAGGGGGGGSNNPPSIPSTPTPVNGAVDQNQIITLLWECEDQDGDDLTYDVYFGTTPNPFLAGVSRPSEFWSPGQILMANTVYYWKVVAKDGNGGETTGPVWTFTTGASGNNNPPDAPANPSPGNGAVDQGTSVVLSWTCTDPDSDLLTYDVYYGINNPPSTVVSGLATAFTTLNSLDSGRTYYWQVVADDGNGGETSGPIWSFSTAGTGGNSPPGPPNNPDPPNNSMRDPGTITFSWDCDDPDEDPLTYDFFYGFSDPPTQTMQDLTTNSVDMSVPANSVFFWKVTAEDGNGGFTAGPRWMVSTTGGGGDNDPPDAPSNPSPGDGGTVIGSQVTLTWNASDPDLDPLTFDVYAGTSNPPFLVSQDQTAYSYIFNGLTPGATYYWRIVAEDDGGETTSGPTWTFDVLDTGNNQPPNAPSNPDPQDGAGNVTGAEPFTWSCSDPDEDPLTYDVYLGPVGQPLLVAQDLDVASYVVQQVLTDGQEYVWYVRAFDDSGANTTGPSWTFTAGSENTPPDQASNPTPPDDASSVSTNATLSWTGNDPDLDALWYDVYFGTAGSQPALVSEDQTTTTFDPGALNNGTSYVWRIDTRDEHGAITPGQQWGFTTSFTSPR